jgi:hypothetical protein
MATQDTDEGYEGKPGWFPLIARSLRDGDPALIAVEAEE